jgi:hypothetical protein
MDKENKFFENILEVGRNMSNEYIHKGNYFPESAWGCEGQIYPSQMGIVLLELYKVQKDILILDGVKSLIVGNLSRQLKSGGWPLSLASTANGIRFTVSQHIKDVSATIEDLPSTAATLRLMADYQFLTNDESFFSSLNLGFNYLIKFWNDSENIFDEMLSDDILKLRANPKNYQIYVYQCIVSLSKILPEAKKYINPLYNSLKKIFEEMDSDTYPLLYSLYACLIIENEKASHYVLNVVKNRIVNDIAMGSRFSIKNVPGAMGHRDGLRGICLDEGHLRNSIGAALALKFYDLYVENGIFVNTSFYLDLEKWILSMYNKGRFYEFIDLKTGVKQGLGTPGQFLPLNLALTKI